MAPPQDMPPVGAPDEATGDAVPPSGKTPSLQRFAIHEGDLRIRARGLPRRMSADVYHRLMRLSWPRLFTLFIAVFLGFNLVFACLYRLDPEGLANSGASVAAPLFWRDFFFSIDTVATIGYGNVYPVSLWANGVTVIEITLGILYFALATGIAFARFSRPTARILFSRVLIVHDIGGVPTLMLRAANQRHNLIYSAEARLAVLVDSEVAGVRMRRFVDLALERRSNPTFALTWTIMHPIDDKSPLAAWLGDPKAARDEDIIVILSGTDEISGQTIHGRWAYSAADVRWNARFVDIITSEGNGWRTIDYRRFHDVLPAGESV